MSRAGTEGASDTELRVTGAAAPDRAEPPPEPTPSPGTTSRATTAAASDTGLRASDERHPELAEDAVQG